MWNARVPAAEQSGLIRIKNLQFARTCGKMQMFRACLRLFGHRADATAFAERGDNSMKKGIHHQYKDTTITCACGNVIHTRSTKENIRVEICSKCHPFFTGKQKLVDSSGRVDMFKKRYGISK